MNIRRYYGTIHLQKFLVLTLPGGIEYAFNDKIFFLAGDMSYSLQYFVERIHEASMDAHSRDECISFRLVTDARP